MEENKFWPRGEVEGVDEFGGGETSSLVYDEVVARGR